MCTRRCGARGVPSRLAPRCYAWDIAWCSLSSLSWLSQHYPQYAEMFRAMDNIINQANTVRAPAAFGGVGGLLAGRQATGSSAHRAKGGGASEACL